MRFRPKSWRTIPPWPTASLNKREYFYGLSISPKLVNTLSVSSLALGQFLADDEWLDINMDEESFYTLKLTT